MPTKAQIARKMYGTSLANLTSGQKAAVTKEFNRTNGPTPVARAPRAPATPTKKELIAGFVLVKFGRPGVNGCKDSIVKDTATVKEALDQVGVTLNPTKEGIINKDGKIIMFNDIVIAETLYVVVPGVDSSY